MFYHQCERNIFMKKLKSIFFTANQKLIIPNFSQLSIFWNKGLKWQKAQIRRAEYFHTTKSFQEKLLQRQCVQKTLGFCIFFFNLFLFQYYTTTYKSRLTQKKLHKKTDAIFSIYGKTGIIPWHLFQIFSWAFWGHWGRMTSVG